MIPEKIKLMDNPYELFELNESIELFLLLLEKCSEEEIYSVRELVTSMNVPYEKIQELAASDEDFSHILVLCRDYCFSRAMNDGLCKKLKFEEAVKYMEENDDDFKVPDDFFNIEDDKDC